MLMSKSVIALYIIPSIFLGMILVYWKENLFTWLVFFCGLIVPILISYGYIKNGGNIKGVLIGNVIFFITNITPIIIINKMNIMKETGQMWHGYFKPLYTEQLFVLLFMGVLMVEIFVCSIIKNK